LDENQKTLSTHYCPKRSVVDQKALSENRRLVVVIVIVEWQHVDHLRVGPTSFPVVVVVDEAVVGLAVVGENLRSGS